VIYFLSLAAGPLVLGVAWGLAEHWLWCVAVRRRERAHRRRVQAAALRQMDAAERRYSIPRIDRSYAEMIRRMGVKD
jgi:hypothetical protein